jgi:hypothetical protein
MFPGTSAIFNHLKQMILSSLPAVKVSEPTRVFTYFTCLEALLPSLLVTLVSYFNMVLSMSGEILMPFLNTRRSLVTMHRQIAERDDFKMWITATVFLSKP